jgi:hypothetical protein
MAGTRRRKFAVLRTLSNVNQKSFHHPSGVMTMRLNKQLSLAVVAAFAAPSSAYALDIAALNAAPVVHKVWITGATAPTLSIYKGARKTCVLDANGNPTDLHFYADGAAIDVGTTGQKFLAYACTNANSGVPTIIYHTGDVGSFEAYTPHLYRFEGATSTYVSNAVKRLKNIQATTGNTCALSASVVPGTSGPGGYAGDPIYTGCGNTTVTIPLGAFPAVTDLPTVPSGGFSDTEYLLNKINLGINTSLGDIGSEDATNVGQAFGLGVSAKLYWDLQQEQFGAASSCVSGHTVSSLDLSDACRPSINSMQYASLVSVEGVSASGRNDTIFKKGPGVASTIFTGANTISVQRRVGTSGTQSASNAFFLGSPCATGSPAGALSLNGPAIQLAPSTTTNASGKVITNLNTGSSDVRNALIAAGTGSYAIGVLSLENAAPGTTWNYVKLDSVSPSIDSLNRASSINGDYKFWYELVAFKAADASDEGKAVINEIRTAWSDPTITVLRGLFATAGTTVLDNVNVSRGYKSGNSCSNQVGG